MGTGNHIRIRRQSLLTWASVVAAAMIVSSMDLRTGQLFVDSWLVIMLIAIYIFSTRTFKLSSDRYFLFIGASMPGIVVLEALRVLALPGVGLLAPTDVFTHHVLGLAANMVLAVVVVVAPFAARLRVHRYGWTALSMSVATVASAIILFSGTSPSSPQAFEHLVVARAILEGSCALLAAVALAWLLNTVVGRRPAVPGLPGRGGLRFMISATALLTVSGAIATSSCFAGDWLSILGQIVEGSALFVMVDGLIFRGLEVPVKLITRSRAQLEAGVSAAADGLLIHDLAGRVIAMNWRFRSVTGEQAGDREGSPSVRGLDARVLLDAIVAQVVSPDALQRRMMQFLATPGSEGFERVELRDGRLFEIYSIPYMFEGRLDGRVWSIRDVSVRERTTAQLERTNWRLDNILTAAGDGLFEVNLERGTMWLHSNWAHVVGCDAASAPATWDQFRAMIHPDDLPSVVRELRQPFTRREYRVEFRMPDHGGGWRWFLCVGGIDRIESIFGRPEWILNGVQRDITAEKMQEVEFRRQRGLMEALIENMPLGAFVKEIPSGRYVIWNSTLANLSGVPASQVIGRTDFEALPEDVARRSAKSDNDVVTQGVSVMIENSWLGEEVGRNIRLRKVPVIDADRSVKLIIGIVEDVTRQQQVERLVHQARSMEALGRLAGGIAHDFNNILQVIIGAADALVVGQYADPRGQDEVEQILEAGERARSLIGQLLTFSRQDSAGREELDIDFIISGLLKMLQRLIGADIAVSVKSSGARLLVSAEKSRLEQVFMNLTVNAVDAMPYGGALTISTSVAAVDASMVAGHPRCQPGAYALIVVGDSGIGMPKEVLEHMWEPFFSTKEMGKGTGLGLSTVYGIVDSLGGFIQVFSEIGHGTEFKVYLPLCAPGGEFISDEPPPRIRPLEPATILVAHADAAAVDLEARALEKAGFRVLRAASGPEAVQRLLESDERGGVRLMILDVVMPGMGGRDICDRYRMDHIEIPVVFCSGPAAPLLDDEYLHYVRGRGIRIPYSVRQLMLVVRSMLSE